MQTAAIQSFDRNFWRMRFDAPLERQFNAHYDAELQPRVRMAALAGALLILAHTALDVLMVAPQVLGVVVALRLTLIVLPLLLVTYATSLPKWRTRAQAAAIAASLSSGVGVVAVLAVTDVSPRPLPYEGLILVLFFFYCCGGVRLRATALVAWAVTALYVAAQLWVGMAAQQVMERSVFLVTANLIGMVCSRSVELSARRNFWMQCQLDAMARLDFLTGVLNRRALTEKLQSAWRQAQREQALLNVAILDVDFFKRYNDHYGHPAGDAVLKQVAQVLGGLTQRPLDVTARYGGEEFVCVWYGNDWEEMHRILARLHADIDALGIAHATSDVAQHLTVSVGMVQVQPNQGCSPEAVLQMADEALYAAKAQGRNRSVVQRFENLAAAPARAPVDMVAATREAAQQAAQPLV